MIATLCPGCGKSISFKPFLAGLSVKCPECPAFVLVPKQVLGTETSIQKASPSTLGEPRPSSRPVEPEPTIQLPSLSFSVAPATKIVVAVSDLSENLDERLRPSVWKKRLRLSLLALFVWGVVFVLAWWTEGNSPWFIGSILGVLVFSVVTLGFAIEWVRNRSGAEEAISTLLSLLFLWGIWAIWHVTGNFNSKGIVHVENATKIQLVLELDDRTWCTSSPMQPKELPLRHGRYRLSIRSSENNELLQSMTIHIGRKKSYVLNTLNAEVYYQGTVGYGTIRLGSGTTEPVLVQESWIDVSEIDYLFKEPPQRIAVQRDARLGPSLGETRTYLMRRHPPDWIKKNK